jgi:hypothetical protein
MGIRKAIANSAIAFYNLSMLIINPETGIAQGSVNGALVVIGNLNDDCAPYVVMMPDGSKQVCGVDFHRRWLEELRYQATIFKLETRIRELEHEEGDR